MLTDEIRQQMIAAMKAKDTVAKSVLQTALGEIQSIGARTGQALDDEEAAKVVRKLIKSNEETLAATDRADVTQKLERENEVLAALLPQTMSIEQIVAALEPVAAPIRAAASDGPATGIAMKHLKSSGAPVEGRDVAEAVKRLRG